MEWFLVEGTFHDPPPLFALLGLHLSPSSSSPPGASAAFTMLVEGSGIHVKPQAMGHSPQTGILVRE